MSRRRYVRSVWTGVTASGAPIVRGQPKGVALRPLTPGFRVLSCREKHLFIYFVFVAEIWQSQVNMVGYSPIFSAIYCFWTNLCIGCWAPEATVCCGFLCESLGGSGKNQQGNHTLVWILVRHQWMLFTSCSVAHSQRRIRRVHLV